MIAALYKLWLVNKQLPLFKKGEGGGVYSLSQVLKNIMEQETAERIIAYRRLWEETQEDEDWYELFNL